MLVVAPMSGHFATLLRDTVRTLLATTTSTSPTGTTCATSRSRAGRFGLDEYTDHLIDFLAAMGPGANVVAVCQPCVAALAAAALMAEDEQPGAAGEPDPDGRPDRLPDQPDRGQQAGHGKPIEWFEQNLISRVPVAATPAPAARLSGLRPALRVHAA